MRLLLFLLGIGFAICMVSCSKGSADSNTSYTSIADTGHYYVQTGTITIVAPEGTYTFGSKDNIVIYHRKEKNTPELWVIGCYGNSGGGFEIDAGGAPATGNTTLSYSTFSFPLPQTLNYHYMAYSSTNAGTVTINTYNSNGIAASGTFTLNVGQYLSTNNRLGFTNYTITGSFDLKLNTK